MKLKHVLVLLYTLCLALSMPAQVVEAEEKKADNKTEKVNSADKKMHQFGLSFGGSYSLLAMDAKPYFLGDSTATALPEAINSAGLNIGLFWYQPMKEKWAWRLGMEANVMGSKIRYPRAGKDPETLGVYGFTLDFPLHFLFGRHYRADLQAESFCKWGILAGVRPVAALGLFNSLQPTVKNFNLNIDLGIGRGIALKSTTMRVEAFYSLGLFNVIGENDKDFHTNSISYLSRSFAGLRLYFN